MTKQTFKFMDKAGIVKACASIAVRGKKLDADIQAAAVSIINHIDQHGDVTLAYTLLEAMPKGSRRNSLIVWFTMFGKLMLNENADAAERKAQPVLFNRDGTTDINGAINTMWYDAVKEKPVEELSVIGQLQALIKKIERAANQGKPVAGLEHADALRSIVAKANASEVV